MKQIHATKSLEGAQKSRSRSKSKSKKPKYEVKSRVDTFWKPGKKKKVKPDDDGQDTWRQILTWDTNNDGEFVVTPMN